MKKNQTERISTGRILSLSDAVFAFSLTLLALNIVIPAHTADEDLVSALNALKPNIIHYAISFIVIGSYWIAHHRIFNSIKKYDGLLIWLNLLFLMTITFIPFLTDFMSDYYGQISIAIYGGALGTSSLFLGIVWLHAVRKRFLHEEVPESSIKYGTLKSVSIAGIFYASILVTFVSLVAAQLMWLLAFIIPNLIVRFFVKK